MAYSVFVAALVVLLSWGCDCSSRIDSGCKTSLTNADPHMDQYVGQSYTVVANQEDVEYIYTVGICTDVESTKYTNCAVLQKKSGDEKSEICIGNATSAQVARSPDGVWIELTYTGGVAYGSHCDKNPRTARLVFLCDPGIKGMGHVDFLEENKDDTLCYYLFGVASSAVCGPISYSHTLSVGDVLMIIAAVVVALWLVAMVVGVVYKRLIMGAKGWEQVPLLDFYREFGNLEADGCDLVCRSQPRKVVHYHEPTFGADTDESDEEKDDNLLPM